MTERSEQVWQNLHNALEKKASEAELLRARVAELEATIKDMQADYDNLLQCAKDLYH